MIWQVALRIHAAPTTPVCAPSLQTRRRLEILVVMLIVVNLDDVLFKDMTNGVRGFTIFNMTLLTVVHITCLFAVGTP